MITTSIDHVMDRIKTAAPESRIAVWVVKNRKQFMECFGFTGEKPPEVFLALKVAFADTVVSRSLMGLPNFVGAFCRENHPTVTRLRLREALWEVNHAAA